MLHWVNIGREGGREGERKLYSSMNHFKREKTLRSILNRCVEIYFVRVEHKKRGREGKVQREAEEVYK